MRNEIWNNLVKTKSQELNLAYYLEKYKKYNRGIEIFLVLATASSISAWVIWEKIPFLWSGIIAISQIISLVKPHFPLSDYILELHSKHKIAIDLNYQLEELYFKYQHKFITEKIAIKTYFSLKEKQKLIFDFSRKIILSDNKKIKKRVEESMKIFLKSEYNID
jgi:hypothetical protein